MQTAPTPDDKVRVPDEFDRVARRYDLLCALNPGYGRHLVHSARRLELSPAARVLDLCCGTGLSTRALRRVYPRAQLVALDASAGMLEVARGKSDLQRTGVEFVLGDAMDPAAAGTAARGPFDGVLMAYGIRNVPDPDTCLQRIHGLLRPGGTVCFHEYSVADSAWSRTVWTAVSSSVIVPLGRAATGSPALFRYLQRSVLAWDGVQAFEARLVRAGFAGVETHAMGGWQRGIVHSFLARRAA